jgi:hypothetical protein
MATRILGRNLVQNISKANSRVPITTFDATKEGQNFLISSYNNKATREKIPITIFDKTKEGQKYLIPTTYNETKPAIMQKLIFDKPFNKEKYETLMKQSREYLKKEYQKLVEDYKKEILEIESRKDGINYEPFLKEFKKGLKRIETNRDKLNNEDILNERENLKKEMKKFSEALREKNKKKVEEIELQKDKFDNTEILKERENVKKEMIKRSNDIKEELFKKRFNEYKIKLEEIARNIENKSLEELNTMNDELNKIGKNTIGLIKNIYKQSKKTPINISIAETKNLLTEIEKIKQKISDIIIKEDLLAVNKKQPKFKIRKIFKPKKELPKGVQGILEDLKLKLLNKIDNDTLIASLFSIITIGITLYNIKNNILEKYQTIVDDNDNNNETIINYLEDKDLEIIPEKQGIIADIMDKFNFILEKIKNINSYFYNSLKDNFNRLVKIPDINFDYINAILDNINKNKNIEDIKESLNDFNIFCKNNIILASKESVRIINEFGTIIDKYVSLVSPELGNVAKNNYNKFLKLIKEPNVNLENLYISFMKYAIYLPYEVISSKGKELVTTMTDKKEKMQLNENLDNISKEAISNNSEEMRKKLDEIEKNQEKLNNNLVKRLIKLKDKSPEIMDVIEQYNNEKNLKTKIFLYHYLNNILNNNEDIKTKVSELKNIL